MKAPLLALSILAPAVVAAAGFENSMTAAQRDFSAAVAAPIADVTGVPVAPVAGATEYDKMAALFDSAKGSVPSKGELLHWYSGHVFRKTMKWDDPNKPLPFLLVGTAQSVSADWRLYVVGASSAHSDEPDYFARIGVEERLAREQGYYAWESASAPRSDGDSMTWEFDNGFNTYELRKAQGGYILRISGGMVQGMPPIYAFFTTDVTPPRVMP